MTTLWGSGVVLAILAAVATVSVTGVRWFNATSFDERLGVFGIGIGTLVLIAAALLVLRMLLEAIATFFDMAHDLHRLVAEEDDVQ